MLVIDPINHKANYRVRSNPEMYRTLKRMIFLSIKYLLKRRSLRKAYKNKYSYLTSIDFWDKYLNLKK